MAARLGFEPRQTESESVVLPLHNRAPNGADEQIRTADLLLTKEVLCRLSYISNHNVHNTNIPSHQSKKTQTPHETSLQTKPTTSLNDTRNGRGDRT